jgi:CRP-like cAMP-binding protein
MFESLSLADREALALCFTGRRCAPGEVVFREGEPSASLFLVGEGSLVAVSRAGGAPREVERYAAGQVIGETSLVDHAPRLATVSAVGQAVVYELAEDAVAALRRNAPAAARALSGAAIRGLVRRLRHLEGRLDRELERAGTPW